ncbi:hypothetical protein KCP75_26250 (plasmid) [Salmonella enterica subsp. enterica]|nr:hypothetical protein KCP73_27255 [Salmonella enterica subsp. enterica]QUJ02649.1 hypothetical protein KCP75_26250 [Salmonella enterica subsp. enterica]
MAKPDRIRVKIPRFPSKLPRALSCSDPAAYRIPPSSLREAWRFLIAHAVGIFGPV